MAREFTVNIPDELWVDSWEDGLTATYTYPGPDSIWLEIDHTSKQLYNVSVTKPDQEYIDAVNENSSNVQIEEFVVNYKKVEGKFIHQTGKYTLEEQQEEAIVELLGLYTADRLDKVKDGKLISLLKRLLKEMKAYMKELFTGRVDVNRVISEEVTYTDEQGNPCASKGLASLFQKGGEWFIVDDYKDIPKHSDGGKDIKIKETKVEVEKNEIRIENDYGDVAIIPSKYREEIKEAINSKCNNCIDGIVSTLPSMEDYAGDGTVFPFFKYRKFKNSLPDNLRNTKERDYAMRYYWRHQGKPTDFKEALERDKPMFTLEDDNLYHAPSVESNTLRFLKPKDHPTVQYELDWYNSEDGREFRSNHKLDTSGRFYKYIPINNK